jgi:hypothetical protein
MKGDEMKAADILIGTKYRLKDGLIVEVLDKQRRFPPGIRCIVLWPRGAAGRTVYPVARDFVEEVDEIIF